MKIGKCKKCGQYGVIYANCKVGFCMSCGEYSVVLEK